MTSNFHLKISGEAIDTSTVTTAADVQKLVRKRLLAQAEVYRRQGEALTPAVEEAQRAAREASSTQGTLLPELAEELDKPWDAAAYTSTPYGRYADARRLRAAESEAHCTLRSRQDKRAKHAAGGWGCGFDTIEYAQAQATHSRLAAVRDEHLYRAAALEEKARTFRAGLLTSPFEPVDRRKEERAVKRAAQPAKTAFCPGSWVRFDDPAAGRTRFGVVTDDPAAYDGPAPNVPARTPVRYIVPNDGGATVPMARRTSNGTRSWLCQRPEWGTSAEVLPALAQDGLFEVHILPATAAGTCEHQAAA